MNRIVLALLIAAGLGGALYLLLARPEIPSERPAAARETPVKSAADPLRSQPVETGAAQREALQEQSSAPPTPTAPEPGAATLFLGRCVMKESGEPVAGCQIRVLGTQVQALSGPDGRFSVDVSGIKRPFFALVAGRHDLCAMENHAQLGEGHVRDLGDVPMTVGTSLSGTVIDTENAPVGDAELALVHETIQRTKAGWSASKIVPIRSTSDGSFVPPAALWPGAYKIGCLLHPVITPKDLRLKHDQAPGHIKVQVQRRNPEEMIAGHVYDANGQPAAGIDLVLLGPPLSAEKIAARKAATEKIPAAFRGRVKLPSATARRQIGQARTDDAGAFHFIFSLANRQDNDDSGAWIESRQSETHRRHTTPRIPWKSLDVIISLTPADADPGSLTRIAVLDDTTEAPITGFKGNWREVGDLEHPYRRGFMPLSLGAEGPHPDGRITLPNLDDGHYSITVIPTNKDDYATTSFEVEMPRDRGKVIPCRLQKMIAFTLEVTDPDDKPVAGSKVSMFGSHPPEFGRPVFAKTGTTDAEGRFTMRRPPDLTGMTFSVMGPHLPAQVSLTDVTAAKSSHRMQISRGVKLRGRVVPLARWQELAPLKPRLSLLPRKTNFNAALGNPCTPAADGTFTTSPLQEGEHQAVLLLPIQRGIEQTVALDLKVQIPADAGKEILVDVSAVRVGVMEGQLLTNGKPRPNHKFVLIYEGLTARGADAPKPGQPGWIPQRSQVVSTDAEGKFSVPRSPGGVYRVQVHQESAAPFTFVPGAPVVVRTLRHVLAIQLVDGAGQPLAGIREVATSDGPKRTDARGVVEVPLGPKMGLYVYGKDAAGKREKLGPFGVGEGETRTEVQVPWR